MQWVDLSAGLKSRPFKAKAEATAMAKATTEATERATTRADADSLQE
jgi:hypothetical protein